MIRPSETARIRLGVTGSRHGITTRQAITAGGWLFTLLMNNVIKEIHHGACVGADEEILLLAKYLGIPTVAHPSTFIYLTTKFASDETREPKDALERNRDIVDECNVLLALPRTRQEERRSGTWATIRYAEKIGRQIRYVWPDGSMTNTR